MATDSASEQTPLLAQQSNNQALTPVPAGASRSPSVAANSTPREGGTPPAETVPRADTGGSWGPPAGLVPRDEDDESIVVFRRAIGMGSPRSEAGEGEEEEPSTVEEGRKRASGIYRSVLQQRRTKTWQYNVLSTVFNTCHVVQILVGAALTTLGPVSAVHSKAITSLGAVNTVIAGLLALFRGQGLPERLHKDAVEFRRLQDWLEETDALLAAGVLGRDRREVGQLIETAFRKYNAVMASEENNKPENYVRQRPEGGGGELPSGTPNGAPGGSQSQLPSPPPPLPSSNDGLGNAGSKGLFARHTVQERRSIDSDRSDNAMVRLNVPDMV